MQLPIEGLTLAFGKADAATPDGAATYNIATAFDFSINGKMYDRATASTATTPTTDGTTGAVFNAVLPDKACVLVWAVDADDAVSLHQGPIVDVDPNEDTLKSAAQFPLVDLNTYCPFAYTLYQTDGTSAAAGLRPGTGNWDQTGLTATTVDLATLPARPVA